MANDSSSEDEDFGAALAKTTAANAANRAATRKKNNIVVPVAAPKADEDSDEGDDGCLSDSLTPSQQAYGHNRLLAGQWFATRSSAYSGGAHGKPSSDVSPGPEGAYSIIVTYDEHGDLNEEVDGGETILFASTGAADWNKSKQKLVNSATKALDASLKSKKPVRVLRAAPKAGVTQKVTGKDVKEEPALYPAKGLRYDGLYRVVSAMRGEINLRTNGRYDAYCLKRLPIVDENVKSKKAENEYVQPVLQECIRRCGQRYGGYSEGRPKGI